MESAGIPERCIASQLHGGLLTVNGLRGARQAWVIARPDKLSADEALSPPPSEISVSLRLYVKSLILQ
jgi:hypothetical protein